MTRTQTQNHDQHRRDHDAIVQDQHIAADKQTRRNFKEWLRRATVAVDAGDYTLANNLCIRAGQELRAN
jgi:hypothetical protein